MLFVECNLLGCVIVNGFGWCFVNEVVLYFEFVFVMYCDYVCIGVSVLVWMVFDVCFCCKYLCGLIMLVLMMFDLRILDVFCDVFVKVDMIDVLVVWIGVDVVGLYVMLCDMVCYVIIGVDEVFGKGDNVFDMYYGDLWN